MAALFTFGLFAYYWLVLRRDAQNRSILALVLLFSYLCLGLSGVFIAVSGSIEPLFEPNYPSTILLLLCTILSITGFLRFRAQDISQTFGTIRGQLIIENILISTQLFAIAYFLPFAMSSLTGDSNENRLLLTEKIELMGSYGLVNTVAGAASQLFSSALVLAFIRLASSKDEGRSVLRALLLTFSSFSYVVYILAYVGRDGVVYWLMTTVMIFLIFRRHLDPVNRRRIALFGLFVAVAILMPFGIITIARFYDSDQGGWWSFFAYFGAQIHTFSDYSSLDRPVTFGLQNFPMFANWGCTVLGLDCASWSDIRAAIFEQYLIQGKEPWLFGTFISDFVADFGNFGTVVIMIVFSIFCTALCTYRRSKSPLSIARLLLILFVFLVPYWGIFYFRFSIANGFIVVNLGFILFVAMLQRKRQTV